MEPEPFSDEYYDQLQKIKTNLETVINTIKTEHIESILTKIREQMEAEIGEEISPHILFQVIVEEKINLEEI